MWKRFLFLTSSSLRMLGYVEVSDTNGRNTGAGERALRASRKTVS